MSIKRPDNAEIAKKRRQIETNTKWKIDARKALEKRGINKPFALWQKIGGSKETATQLFNGTVVMIRLETFDRLWNELGISPFEIIVNTEKEK
ncbi:MAG: helix-turn-helix transcriptional regulator [Acidobacteria bacterium]|nr:helix-turn-helix transcriptional regulator [Acidobacteriota bacterium]